MQRDQEKAEPTAERVTEVEADAAAQIALLLPRTVANLAAFVGEPIGEIYKCIYDGSLRHSRRGRRIRVRAIDWLALAEANVVEPGQYVADPDRQQEGIRRAAVRAERTLSRLGAAQKGTTP